MLTISLVRLIFIIFLLPCWAFGNQVEIAFKNDTLLGADTQDLTTNNRLFNQFEHAGHLELRPSLVANYTEYFKLTLRPRFEFAHGNVPNGVTAPTKSKKDLWLNEGFVTITPRDNIQLAVGRQNYLWGPSEVVSPSNPFYSDLINRPSPLFLLRGINLARLNLSYGSEYTLVTMVETNSMNDADFEMRFPEKETNQHRVLVKGDYSSTDGQWNVGVTAGKRNKDPHRKIVGGYLMWTANSAIQLYSDLRIDETPTAHIPYYVAGARYTFENGLEWRNDFIYKKDADPIITPINQDNLFYEKYYYTSLRKSLSAFSIFQNPLLGLRSLYATSNDSGIVSGFFESGLNDFTTLTLYGGKAHGNKNEGYKQLFDSMAGFFVMFSY